MMHSMLLGAAITFGVLLALFIAFFVCSTYAARREVGRDGVPREVWKDIERYGD